MIAHYAATTAAAATAPLVMYELSGTLATTCYELVKGVQTKGQPGCRLFAVVIFVFLLSSRYILNR